MDIVDEKFIFGMSVVNVVLILFVRVSTKPKILKINSPSLNSNLGRLFWEFAVIDRVSGLTKVLPELFL